MKKGFVLCMTGLLLALSLFGCGKKAEPAGNGGEFASFQGQDLDGNKVDENILKDNKVTVLNFWFNGCLACVSEMSGLEKFNEQLKEKGAELVGVNVENVGGQKVVDEAKKILKEQGATYKNIMLTSGDKAMKYMGEMVGYPTTVLVDKNGNVIAEPICGTIDDEENMQKILKTIEEYQEK